MGSVTETKNIECLTIIDVTEEMEPKPIDNEASFAMKGMQK